MNDSILISIRDALGYSQVKDFDNELILHINSAFEVLRQNGYGNPIHVTDETNTWDEFTSDDNEMLDAVKHYVYLFTRQLFDPPAPNAADRYDRVMEQLLWRIRENHDFYEYAQITEEVTNEN